MRFSGRISQGGIDAAAGARASFARALAAAFAISAVSGCLSNIGGAPAGSSTQRTTDGGEVSGDPTDGGTGTSGGATSLLVLSRVVKSNSDPAKNFDFIGDGSGTMGQFCLSSTGTSTTEGPSTCQCVYSFTRTDGTTEVFESPTIYREANLLRCSYTGVPSNIPFVKVKVHLTNSDTYSNEITYRLTGTGVSLDVSNAETFVMARRFQCRDAVTVPYLYDENVYDPYLSEKPEISYALNFYASNFGAAFSAFSATVSQGGTGWICPPTPNDSAAGLDLTVYSRTADSAGSKRIFPAAGSAFDRSTFFLAREKTGVFSVPFNAYAGPNVLTCEGTGCAATTVPPIGYGAAPIRLADDQETCPDTSTAIPSGFKWVKVWAFRASLETRKVPRSQKLAELGAIACNPGYWQRGLGQATPTYDAIFSDCDLDGMNNTNDAASMTLLTPSDSQLADRVIANNGRTDCVKLIDSNGDPTAGLGGVNYSIMPEGADLWDVKTLKGNPSTSCGQSNNSDPAKLCDPGFGEGVPFDNETQLVDIDNGISRFDVLFVVSPTTVMTKDFREGRPASLPYTPYRFYSPSYCQSADPDNPSTPGDCPSNKTIVYGFENRDVTITDGPPAGDPSSSRVFPVCALQPI